MSGWVDITRRYDESLLLWPGRALPECLWEKRIDGGHHCNVSTWKINAHTGTHMDAPLHFYDDGKSIDQIAPETFVGACHVIDLAKKKQTPLEEKDVQSLTGCERLLIKTAHSQPNAGGGYPAHEALMTPAAIALLVKHGLVLLGTDRLSVDDSRGESYALHNAILGGGAVIIEGLMLSEVQPGEYQLYAAPLKLGGGEASPVRALLRAA